MSEQLTQPAAVSEEQRSAWVRSQFQKANEYLASKGILPDNVAVSESRYIPPYLAIWKLNTKDHKAFWVLSGDLPTDHLPLSAAPDAREALRAFALHWQLKAEQLLQAGLTDQTQQDFVNLLISRAESLYAIFTKDELWQQS